MAAVAAVVSPTALHAEESLQGNKCSAAVTIIITYLGTVSTAR